MTDSPHLPADTILVAPDEVEQAAIDTLGLHHPRHLAAFERQRGLNVRTIERFKTIDLYVDEQQFRLDDLPAIFVGASTLASPPEDRRDTGGASTFDLFWRLELHVVCLGGGQDPRADSMQACRWMTMTALECLLRRLPGYQTSVPIGAVQPLDVAFEGADGAAGAHLAHSEASLSILIPSAITGKGGPLLTEDPDPYVPPYGAQAVTADATVNRDPISS